MAASVAYWVTLVPRTVPGIFLLAMFTALPIFGPWYLTLLTVLSSVYWTWTMFAFVAILYRLYNFRSSLALFGVVFKDTPPQYKFKVTLLRYLDHDASLILSHLAVFLATNLVWPTQITGLSTDVSSVASVVQMIYDFLFFTRTLSQHGFAQYQAVGNIGKFFSMTHQVTSMVYFGLILSTLAVVLFKTLVIKALKKQRGSKDAPGTSTKINIRS